MADRASTRQRIVEAARMLCVRDGIGALTLDGVAEEVGVTKQAVLYHYGSRSGLLTEVFLTELAREADALCPAAAAAEPGVPAVEAALRALLRWHLEDPVRFRMVYAANQLARVPEQLDAATSRERLYPLTSRIYDTLETHLRAAPQLPEGVDARRLAVALHMLVIGIAGYAGMLEAAGERMLHDWEEVLDSMMRTVAAGLGA